MAKKRGRPKKRGPKKKIPKKVYKDRHTWDYKIVSCRNGRQNGYFGCFVTPKDAYHVIDMLMAESDKVVFPKKVVNSHGESVSNDEYVILKRNKGDNVVPLLRNEYGKLVEHKTNTEKWTVFDKFRYYVEENFWVYGYDPRLDRKTFIWIYNYIVVGKIRNKYDYKRVILYNNKLVIKDDSDMMDMIICKNKSEAIRMYNMLNDYVTKNNHKQVVFLGAYGGRNRRTSSLIKDICAYTGWPLKKVIRQTTF